MAYFIHAFLRISGSHGHGIMLCLLASAGGDVFSRQSLVCANKREVTGIHKISVSIKITGAAEWRVRHADFAALVNLFSSND